MPEPTPAPATPQLHTFAFSTPNKKAVRSMQRALERLVSHMPEEWEGHLVAALVTMERSIKIGDFSRWVELITLYGLKCSAQHMEMIEKGQIPDDCDCTDCVCRRAYTSFSKDVEGQKTSETFQRYFRHFTKECAFKETPVPPWQEVLQAWQGFDLQQKMDSSESGYWTYAAAEKDTKSLDKLTQELS